MTVPAAIRNQVRERANFTCEFCGVTETDTGAELTVDHFRPRAKGGDDDPDNLLYSCVRCNQYKLDYWPADASSPSLWNPRREPGTHHFVLLDDGTLHPLTPTGEFTLRRLRLNRPALVACRQRKKLRAEGTRLLLQHRGLVQLLEEMNSRLSALAEEQQQLLAGQRELLRLLLDRNE